MAQKTLRVVLADDDPVTRLIGMAADWDAGDLAWLKTYLGSDASRDPAEALTEVRGALGGAAVSVSRDGRLEDAHVIVTRTGRIDRDVLGRAPKLRLLQQIGRWPQPIDVEAARQKGVPISCLPRPSLALTAEHAILLMLASGKQLRRAHLAIRDGKMSPLVSPESGICYNWPGLGDLVGLSGATVGLIGLGEVGREAALRLRGFDARVLYFQRHRLTPDMEARLGVAWADLDDLLATSDFVSLHIRHTKDTRHWMNREKFLRMKPGAFFVNTTRGGAVDEEALFESLASGRLRGAGLDVHAEEPCAVDALRSLDNVILTPHIAGGPRGLLLEEARGVLGNLAALSRGEAPTGLWTEV